MHVLQNEGHTLGHHGLIQLRKKHGMQHRVSGFNREAADAQLLQVVKAELDKGHIEGYGHGLLYTYFCMTGHLASRKVLCFRSFLIIILIIIIIYRDQLFRTVKQLDPAGHERCTRDLQHYKGELIVPGPNYLWSIDGHMKLEPWGFEIYAGIDAFSCYVPWLYVGTTCCTNVSVTCQYLNTVKELRVCPQILWSDRGKETSMIADAH